MLTFKIFMLEFSQELLKLIRAFSDFKAFFYIFCLAALASEDVTISKPQISGCSMGARIQDVSVEFTLCFCR